MAQLRVLRLACLAAFVWWSGNRVLASDAAKRAEDAAQAMRAGSFEEAARIYRELVSQYASDANLRLSLATALYSARHYTEAQHELAFIRAGQKQNEKFWLLLGETELKLGEPAKALEPLQHAVELAPGNDAARLELASTELEVHQLAAAEKQYRVLSNNSAKSAAAWKGLALSQLGISNQALDSLKASAPHSSYLYGLAAVAAAESGDAVGAAKLYDKALAMPPVAEWMRAELLAVQQGSPPAPCHEPTFACRFFNGDMQSLAVDVTKLHTPEAWYWTTRVYGELARQSMETLNGLPACSEQHELMARLYAQNGRRSEAIQELREAAKLKPEDQVIKSDLAEALWADRQYDEAVGQLSGLIESSPDQAEWQFELGDALFNTGKPEDGILHLRKAVAFSPGLLPAQARLGEALLRTGDTAGAVSHLERAASFDRDGSIHFQLATAYRKLGRPEAAAKAMERQKELAAAKPKAEQ